MALWGSNDEANNAPKYAVVGGLGVSANGQVLYQNTQTSLYVTGAAVGVFGVDTTEAGITTGEGKKIQHAGWNLRKAGTGPVTSIVINDGGDGYSNGFITFTSTNGSGANASYTVNSVSGAIVSVTLLAEGSGYDVAPTADGTDGANSDITVVVGGRAGRVQYETLVAMGSIGVDGSSGDDDTLFPDS